MYRFILFIGPTFQPHNKVQPSFPFFSSPNICHFLILTGMGIGVVFGCLMLAYARNPSLKQQLFSYAILGFALAEAMGLMCIMVTFLLLFGV